MTKDHHTGGAWHPMQATPAARRLAIMPTVPHSAPLDADDLRVRVHKAIADFISRQRGLLDGISDDLEPLVEAVTDLCDGGKRLRPAFAWWGWRGAGGADIEQALNAVASLEFLQACALIHDDVMDGSDTRRGLPSAHRRFASVHRQSASNPVLHRSVVDSFCPQACRIGGSKLQSGSSRRAGLALGVRCCCRLPAPSRQNTVGLLSNLWVSMD